MPRIVFDIFRKHFDVSLMVLGSLVKIFFGPRVQFVQPWIFKLHFSCAVVFLVRPMSLTHTHGVAVFWQNFSLNPVSISGAYTYKVVVFFSLDVFFLCNQATFVNFPNIFVVYTKQPNVGYLRLVQYCFKLTKFNWHYIGQICNGDFANFCGLLRIYKLYQIVYKLSWVSKFKVWLFLRLKSKESSSLLITYFN